MKHVLFKSVTIRNFFTYGNVPTTVDLTVPGCTLISGVDMDNVANGPGANGVGKSTVLNALLYLLGNIIPDGLSIDDVVNNINKKNCMVSGDVDVDGTTYTFTKYRKSDEKPEKNYIEIFKNGDVTHNLAKGTMAETTKYISDIIGIQPDILSKLILIDVNSTPFFRESGPRQREIMEDLFDMGTLVDQSDKLSDNVKQTKSAIVEAQHEYDMAQRLYVGHTQRLSELSAAVSKWDMDTSSKIDEVSRQILTASAIDIEQARLDIQHNIDIDNQAQHKYTESAGIQQQIAAKQQLVKQLGGNLASANREKDTHTQNMMSAVQKIASIGKVLETLKANVCPECNQAVDEHHVKSQLELKQAEIKTLEAKIIDLNQKITGELTTNIQTLNNTLESETHALSELLKELASIKDQINNILSTKKQLISVCNTHSSIDKLQQVKTTLTTQLETLKTAINPYNDLYSKECAESIDPPSTTILDALKLKLSHQQFLHKLLTDKKSFIRKHLIDKRLSILNSRIHGYLTELGLPHSLTFNSDLSVSICRMGRPIPYGGLSGGQKARVDFAVRLAFRDILQISSTRVPFLMIDEALDHGLDDVGVQMATTVLHSLSKTQKCGIFIITHKSEIVNRFPQRLVVQLKDGFSSTWQENVTCLIPATN